MRPSKKHTDWSDYARLEDAFGKATLDGVFKRFGAGRMLACGANGCVWAMDNQDWILKITRDPNEVEFAARRMKAGSSLDDVFARVREAETLQKVPLAERPSRRVPTELQRALQTLQKKVEDKSGQPPRSEIGGVLVVERVYPILPECPIDLALTTVAEAANQVNLPWMPQNEEVVAVEIERFREDRRPDWSLVGTALDKFKRLYYAAKDMNVYDVIPEAHGSNWGCRRKNDMESAVLIDFGGIPR